MLVKFDPDQFLNYFMHFCRQWCCKLLQTCFNRLGGWENSCFYLGTDLQEHSETFFQKLKTCDLSKFVNLIQNKQKLCDNDSSFTHYRITPLSPHIMLYPSSPHFSVLNNNLITKQLCLIIYFYASFQRRYFQNRYSLIRT